MHSTIDIFWNNLAVVQMVTISKTRTLIGACIRNIWLISAALDTDIRLRHIFGKCNLKADLLSRLFSDKSVDHALLSHLNTIDIDFQTHILRWIFNYSCRLKPGFINSDVSSLGHFHWPSARKGHTLHFKTFLAFLYSWTFLFSFALHNILAL